MKALQGEWPEHVRAWRRSGETAQAYCTKRGLSVHVLRSWSARMQDEKKAPGAASKSGAELRMALVRPAGAATMAATKPPALGVGVRLRVGEVCVELAPGFDGETLARVLDVLEQREATP
jgi:hypothetical protein